jgi:hypothetical protein
MRAILSVLPFALAAALTGSACSLYLGGDGPPTSHTGSPRGSDTAPDGGCCAPGNDGGSSPDGGAYGGDGGASPPLYPDGGVIIDGPNL